MKHSNTVYLSLVAFFILYILFLASDKISVSHLNEVELGVTSIIVMVLIVGLIVLENLESLIKGIDEQPNTN